jgi:hypothetical protein
LVLAAKELAGGIVEEVKHALHARSTHAQWPASFSIVTSAMRQHQSSGQLVTVWMGHVDKIIKFFPL